MTRHDHVRGIDLLLLPERVVLLNGPAAAVLALCDGSRTVAVISTTLEGRYGQAGLETVVGAFLRKVHGHRWVT